MKIETVTLLCVLTIFVSASAFAQVPATEQNYTNVTFILTVATNVISIDSNFLMEGLITNSSKEMIGRRDIDLTYMSLMAPSGDIYHFPLMRSDYENMISHKTMDGILPDSTYMWPLSFKLDEKVDFKKNVPGTYILQATCRYFATRALATFYLTSNPVEVKIE